MKKPQSFFEGGQHKKRLVGGDLFPDVGYFPEFVGKNTAVRAGQTILDNLQNVESCQWIDSYQVDGVVQPDIYQLRFERIPKTELKSTKAIRKIYSKIIASGVEADRDDVGTYVFIDEATEAGIPKHQDLVDRHIMLVQLLGFKMLNFTRNSNELDSIEMSFSVSTGDAYAMSHSSNPKTSVYHEGIIMNHEKRNMNGTLIAALPVMSLVVEAR